MSRRVAALNFIKGTISRYTNRDIQLLYRLTHLQEHIQSCSHTLCGELFIHWWYRDRLEDRLTSCEIFHLNMLQYFNVPSRMETIHIRCASSSVTMTNAMEQAIRILSKGKATVDFKLVPSNKGWEHDTFKEATEYAIGTGKYVYYTHFKGASRIGDASLGIAPRLLHTSTDLDIYYWCYLMYVGLFTAPNGYKAIGPLVHLGINGSYTNRDIKWSNLCKDSEVFHYCGSFQAFSGEYIKSCLEECSLGTLDVRLNKLWVGDPYTVEMFLSMVSLKDDVYSLDIPYTCTNNIYNVYTHNRIPQYMDAFRRLYEF